MDSIHSPILAAFRKAHDAHDVSFYSCLTFDVQRRLLKTTTMTFGSRKSFLINMYSNKYVINFS